jgi:ribosome-associated protein
VQITLPAERAPVARFANVAEIQIRGETIRLGQLLKLAGLVDSGGDVKLLLEHDAVLVNGERETRRGRQLHPGDSVRVGEDDLVIVAGSQGALPG